MKASLGMHLSLPLLAVVVVASMFGCDPPAPPPSQVASGHATSIMPFDQVRVGMRGYGKTVFHGTRIESFPVEVISVERNYEPKLNVIWIRCPDARMQQSGPVQGMSGSPIYLWDEGARGELGRGGRLIGAFAFGYGGSKDCYVGVQPIENMMGIVDRAVDQPTQSDVSARLGDPRLLERLLASTAEQHIDPARLWRISALNTLLNPDRDPSASEPPRIPRFRGPDGLDGEVTPLMLPVNVGSPQVASLLAPLMAPTGIAPIAVSRSIMTGAPPPGIDLSTVKLAPGSVLAIPLGWGDADLSASGTVTDVLPDGRVLGFGHAMDGQGPASVPIANGFVHMVMPMTTISFKLGGSGQIKGALIRDENTGVLGSPSGTFESSPVKVTVRMPGQPQRDYSYEVVRHRELTPVLATIVSLVSMQAMQAPPSQSTMRVHADMRFAKGYTLSFETQQVPADPFGVISSLLGPLSVMSSNYHEAIMLESMDVTIDVEDMLSVGTLAEGRLDRAEIAPGQTLGMTMSVHPFGKPAVDHRIELKIPDDTPDGDYQIIVSDANTYMQLWLGSRPHLVQTSSIDELHAMLARIQAVRSDAIYVTMLLPEEGLAIGQEELPGLPSSAKALIASPVSTLATTYHDSIVEIKPMNQVIMGERRFMIRVDHTLAQ
jgi:hypothetical protein